MIDRLFTATLTFCLLAGGTVAIWSAMMDYEQRAAAVRNARPAPVVQLPAVIVIGKRQPAAAVAQTEALEPAAKVVQ